MLANERSSASLSFPDHIESYRLVKQIGKGAFGVVYKATFKDSSHPQFAIKIVRPVSNSLR